MRFTELTFGLWALSGVALAFGMAAIGPSFLSFIPVVAWLGWGLVVWAWLLLEPRTGPRRPVRKLLAFLGPPLVVGALYVGGGPIQSAGATFWAGRTLATHRAGYEEVAQALAEGRAVDPDAPDHVVDEGPPVRIAFRWGAGVVDNWRAIVHDPSGLVLRANEVRLDDFDWNDEDLTRVRRLFGGDLYLARPLGGDYYLCYFT